MRGSATFLVCSLFLGCVEQSNPSDPTTATVIQGVLLADGIINTGASLQGSGTAADPVDVIGARTATLNQVATSNGAGGISWSSSPSVTGFSVTGTGQLSIGSGPLGASVSRINLVTENSDDAMQIQRFSPNANAPKVNFMKALGTRAAPGAVSVGVRLFDMIPWGYDGSQFRKAGTIEFDADYGVTPGIVPGRFKVFTTDPAGVVRERFRVDSTGHWVVVSNGNIAPTVSGCGTGASVTGTDVAGTIVEGTGATGCTLNFAVSFAVTGTHQHCTVTSQAGLAFSYVPLGNGNGVLITNIGALSSTALSYTCIGVF